MTGRSSRCGRRWFFLFSQVSSLSVRWGIGFQYYVPLAELSLCRPHELAVRIRSRAFSLISEPARRGVSHRSRADRSSTQVEGGPPDFDAMTDVGGQAKLIKRGARVPAGHDAPPAGRRPTAGQNGQLTVATPRGKNGSQAEARRPRPNTLSLLPFLPTDILYLSPSQTPTHTAPVMAPTSQRAPDPERTMGIQVRLASLPMCVMANDD